MNSIILVLLFQLAMILLNVKAQENSTNSQDAVSNFQPSLAVVIGILSILFSLTFLLLLYAKFCHRPAAGLSYVHNLQIQDGLLRSRSRTSGIDKTVVESLPFFIFSSLKGAREGLECAVCLSRFEDVEILRLLPKCKHAFHIACIDQWLENHSTCPLCRDKITPEDLSALQYSNSLRFLLYNNSNNNHDHDHNHHQNELRAESNLELSIHREENTHPRYQSSRFSILSSFRKSEKQSPLHKVNHRINIVSDVVLKNRWSNLSSSDLTFLSSKMIHDSTSCRFSSSMDRNINDHQTSMVTRLIGEEVNNPNKEMNIKKSNSFRFQPPSSSSSSESRMGLKKSTKMLTQNEKRSMSEIVIHPRFGGFNFKNGNREFPGDSAEDYKNVKDERRRKAWLPIARRTVEWFANRETRSNHQSPNTRQSLNL